MKLHEVVQKVKGKEDFMQFLALLVSDLKMNGDNWENPNLESYLEGIRAWVGDMEEYYKNKGIEVPQKNPWQLLADVLYAAKMYE